MLFRKIASCRLQTVKHYFQEKCLLAIFDMNPAYYHFSRLGNSLTLEKKSLLAICKTIFFLYSEVFIFILKYKFIYFNWRLITLQHCIGFTIHQHESTKQLLVKFKNCGAKLVPSNLHKLDYNF